MDAGLAGLDPKKLPMSLKIGIAPIMRIALDQPFWGKLYDDEHIEYPKGLEKLVGIYSGKEVDEKVRAITGKLGAGTKARELAQHLNQGRNHEKLEAQRSSSMASP